MNAQQILETAKSEGWKRKQVKEACYAHKIEIAQREAIYAALGMAATGPAQAAEVAQAAPEQPEPIAAQTKEAAFGNMTLKFAATDKLTGETISAGTRVIGVRLGGEWDFTAVRTNAANFRKACEAALFSNDPEEGGPNGNLDSDDYRLLASYGNEFPYFQRFIACDVPGLAH